MKPEDDEGLDPLVPALQRFNRFYSRFLGTLERGVTGTSHTRQEAQVIIELSARPGCTANEIMRGLEFSQGHLSRLVARLEGAGLVRKKRSERDRRAKHLFLTAKGRRAFAVLERRGSRQANEVLARLDGNQKRVMATALRNLHSILDPSYSPGHAVLRERRVGDIGWLLYRHAVVYRTEFGYRDDFETYVCEDLPVFLDNYDARRDHLWVAECDGSVVGFVGVQHADNRPGWARLRWFLVEREVRGRGIGQRLLSRAIGFIRKAGYRGVFLWTVSDLDAARRSYERAGFHLAEERAGREWAPRAKEQRWELDLR